MRATHLQVSKLIEAKHKWILAVQLRSKSQIHNHSLPAIDKRLAREYLTSRLELLSSANNLNYNRVSFRSQKTRWGSCSSRKNISLNYKLLTLKTELIDYVILHELAHTKHMNHSLEFWNFLELICVGAKKHHRELKHSLPNL
ncbi:MAG: M48 family metallopeptidase [Candidatus Parcubacteria bacterium]|nr:M48 family metallopeptidase [Candidatus Paceibacterota bacterium]